MLESVARAIITDGHGTLAEQVDRRAHARTRACRRSSPSPARAARPRRRRRCARRAATDPRQRARRLHARTAANTSSPPTPGSARRRPGSTCWPTRSSARSSRKAAAAYTWSENAHEFRLTPWSNDPVSDASGEAFYLRDEETGQYWSPTPLPARGRGAVRHASRLRLQRVRARRGRHPLRALRSMSPPTRRSSSRVLKIRNDSGARAAHLGDRLCRMGAGRPAAEIGRCTSSPKSTARRRAVRAQRLQHGVRPARGVLRRRRRRRAR